MSRQKIIEDRKEYLEKLNTEREEEEVRRQEEMLRQQLAAEQRRLEVERQERERLRQEAEIRQVQARHLKEKVAQFSQTAIGQKVMDSTLLTSNLFSCCNDSKYYNHLLSIFRLLKRWTMKILANLIQI